jgi:hypothetical protein
VGVGVVATLLIDMLICSIALVGIGKDLTLGEKYIIGMVKEQELRKISICSMTKMV